METPPPTIHKGSITLISNQVRNISNPITVLPDNTKYYTWLVNASTHKYHSPFIPLEVQCNYTVGMTVQSVVCPYFAYGTYS